ncbi:MAG: alpha/beta fold hydrolase [Proteobacteria bacterium]|nr:alpha/beta fold hydrolase [Pseudomonadota bacterium]
MADLSIPTPTLGGKQFWADLLIRSGHRIQENVYTGRCRLLGARDTALASGTFEECKAALERRAAQMDMAPRSDHLVLALHGIFRSKDAFWPMIRALHSEGFEAETVNYPSTRRSLEQHADQLERILENTVGIKKVSFVAHSMGGLVVRVLLGRDSAWRKRLEVGRVVMIGTPNQGAVLVDLLRQLWAFRTIAGPAGTSLSTEQIPSLPVPDVPFATVSGVKGDGAGYNPLLPGDDDMTVSLDSTFLDGAEDEMIVQGVHTFLMRHPTVVRGTMRYLKTGRFPPIT